MLSNQCLLFEFQAYGGKSVSSSEVVHRLVKWKKERHDKCYEGTSQLPQLEFQVTTQGAVYLNRGNESCKIGTIQIHTAKL